jgi:hypothetical protein
VKILSEPLDPKQLRSEIDFVAVASRYTQLRRRARQWVGLCPFHSERHPSFYIHPEKRIFYCFGCGMGGDVFDFIMAVENCGFSRAMQIVRGFRGGSDRGPTGPREQGGRPPEAPKGPPLYIARKPQPKPRAVGELPPLAVDCAAERYLTAGDSLETCGRVRRNQW